MNVTIAGTTYAFPTEGEESWGPVVTNWAVAVSSYLLQRTGGTFSLTADVNFGATFATIQAYLKSRTSNISSAGFIRMARTDTVSWRNQANGADLPLGVDSSNRLTFNGNIIIPSTGVIQPTEGGTGISSYTTGDTLYASAANTLSKLTIGTANYVYLSNGTIPVWALIANANIDAAAAIAYSKLNLSGSIVNADVNASAAIAYSKLNLSGSIVNADVNASAAIAYSKLNLSSSIVNADVSASAAIARSKIAAGTADHVVINATGTGALSSEAQLDETRGGTGIGTYSTGDILYASGANTLAKLTIGSTGQRLAVSAGGVPTWSTPNAALSVTAQTTTYPISTSVDVVLCSGSAFTATLPDAVANAGKAYEIKKTDSSLSNIITIATTSSQTIIGATSPTSTTLNTIGETLWLVSDGANWQVLCRYIPIVTASVTPTGTWNTGITYTGAWTRYGKWVQLQVAINCSTTPNSATLTVNTPTGLTIDNTASVLIQGAATGGTNLGTGTIKDGGSTVYPVQVVYNSTTVLDPRVLKTDGTYGALVAIDQATPITFDTPDSVQFTVWYPVAGWNG